MSQAFAKVFFRLDSEMSVIIGTDCVMITEEDVETAFSLLSGGEFEAVLGPATDGGYYLLGPMRGKRTRFFRICDGAAPEYLRKPKNA